ncbi:hypothetical protein CLF_108442 [Clonorchis sinensis]|uniref:Uncharacterized protein n=1 Tax=Clonorchis sinensis TaxID=79923 RepID=G7YI28_CLOSI|nr:hypothetical protein CLF_108442 [Clonorchis sinensis]
MVINRIESTSFENRGVSKKNERDPSLKVPCINLVVSNATGNYPTSQTNKKLHNFDCHTLDNKCQFVQNQLHILFEDENDIVRKSLIYKILVNSYLNTSVLKTFRRLSHYLVDQTIG